jgi:hypothetical protein
LHPIYHPDGGELVFGYIVGVILGGYDEITDYFKSTIHDGKSPENLGEKNGIARREAFANVLSKTFEV